MLGSREFEEIDRDWKLIIVVTIDLTRARFL
jgi:hypothetical protein